MAEQVNIASLTIDVDDVIKESVRLQKEMDSLKKTQKELDRTTEEGEIAYQKNAAQLKNLTKAYRDNQNFAAALDATNEDLNKTMAVQGKSTQELYDSRRQLNQIAKQIQGNTEEEIELRNQLNQAIDEQTEALREQQSEYNTGKDSIGEYTQGINASDLSIQSLIQNSQEAGGATNLLKGGLKSATSGMLSFIKASLTFIATPVGLVLAAIAGAFLLIKNAMNRNEESAAKVTKAFSGFAGIAKGLLKFLEPLGEFLIDGLVKGFELLEKGVFKALGAIQKGLKLLGLDEAAASLGSFTEQIEESVKASKELTQAELELSKAQRIAQKTQLDYQKQAEKLRQIRDDETKTIAERIKANEELGAVLDKQLNEELKLAQKALDYANLRVKLDGATKDNLDAQAEALTEIADIEERITGQQSEQLTNRVALQKEAAEKAIAIQEAQLEAYLKSNEVRAKSLEESVNIEREAAKQKVAILDNELKNKLISQQEYDAEFTNIQNELLRKQAELAADNARRELQDYIENNESKLDSDKFLSEESFRIEQERLERIAQARRDNEAVRLEEGIISQQEYNDAINAVNEENRLANEALENERKEAEKEQAAIDAENRLQLLEEQSATEYEALVQRLENDRLAEVAAAEKSGADIALINDKYAKRQDKLEKSVNDAKIDGYGQVFDSYASVLGEQTAAGKAAAIASALISTYQGATSAYSSLAGIPIVGPALGFAAAAAAVIGGLKNVAQIRSTPTKYAKGDILKGRSHSRGGIPFSINGSGGFEAEGGEALINKRSTSMFAPLLSAINVAGGGKKFAAGGIAGSTASVPSGSLIDYDLLSSRIAEANESLPSPVVSVEEISTVSNNVAVVESIATI